MKKSIALLLAACVLGVLVWMVWSDGGQARRERRDRALVVAVQRSDLAAATRLLGEGADPNAQTPPTTLSQKVRYYRFMVSNGAKVSPWGHMEDRNQHYSVLEIAAMRGDADMAGLLLSRGADVDYKDRAKGTALGWAISLSGLSLFGPQDGRDYKRVVALLKAARRPGRAAYPAPTLPSHRPMAKTMPPPMMTWTTVWASGLFMKR